MTKIYDKVIKSRSVRIFNKTYDSFEKGKGVLAKFTNMFNEVHLVLWVTVFVFDVDLREYKLQLVICMIIFVCLITLIGYIRIKTGLYASEIHVQTNRNPVDKDKWNAAKIILKEHERWKK